VEPKEKLTRKNAFDGSLQMGIRNFMAKTGRDEHLQHVERRKEFFIDPDTGLLKKEMAAPRSCPMCGADDSNEIFRKEGFRHVVCKSCGFMYVSPVARDEVVAEFYRQEKSWATVLENPTQLEFDRLKFAYGLDVALEYCPPRPRVLDVGCGPGVFIDVARERGLDAAGVELNEQNVADMRARGITVYDRLLDECGLGPGSFDLIALWEVLEHIVEPRPLMTEVARLLSPGGVVLVLVPNRDALVTRLLQARSNTFVVSHVNFFNADSLQELARDCGLTEILRETIVTELGAIRNFLDFQDPYSGQADDKKFSWLTPEFIHDNLLGSKLLALFTTKGRET
jgi:2-polyprenyl-3-methyl-5-hydroxy-6-metoxy-1,4-benzoquinol methylase/predicted RNA-binding Zn-ribbon protein involved in translation (DUF1610 family)